MKKELLTSLINSSSRLSEKALEEITGCFEERTFVKNQYFVVEGKVSNDYLMLTDGFMRAFTFDTDGNEVTTNFFSKNRVVFEVSSFFLRTISEENIQAVTDCRGFSLTYEKLNMLFHSLPEFREFGRTMLAREFGAFKQRTLGLINRSAEERYADLIKDNTALFQHAQLKHIASYLGITDTSLSRIRREFSKK